MKKLFVAAFLVFLNFFVIVPSAFAVSYGIYVWEPLDTGATVSLYGRFAGQSWQFILQTKMVFSEGVWRAGVEGENYNDFAITVSDTPGWNANFGYPLGTPPHPDCSFVGRNRMECVGSSGNGGIRWVYNQPLRCSASFNPISGTVVQGQNFNLKGKIESVSGGNGTGYDFMWARKYSYGNYLYPPTVNPTQVGVWYPGRWSSTGQGLGKHYLVLLAKNKDKSWNYAVTCSGTAAVNVVSN